MHAPYDKQKTSDRTAPKSGAGFLILFAAVSLTLVALALPPKTSTWVSQAVEAEFIGNSGIIDTPTRVAQPDKAVPVQTVRVY